MILLGGLHCLSHGLEPVFWEEAVSKPEEEEAGELTQRPSLSLPEPHAFQQYLFPPPHLTSQPCGFCVLSSQAGYRQRLCPLDLSLYGISVGSTDFF